MTLMDEELKANIIFYRAVKTMRVLGVVLATELFALTYGYDERSATLLSLDDIFEKRSTFTSIQTHAIYLIAL